MTSNHIKNDLSLRLMFSHPAYPIGLGFGAGLSTIAPGTVGTIWAWAIFQLVLRNLSDAFLLCFIGFSIILGWWACTRTAEGLKTNDPGAVVWDEIVAFWMILFVLRPVGFIEQLIAFALFRFFDAAKPQPVRWADKCFKGAGWRGGWGIMWDDLVAAFCTLFTFSLWVYFFK